MRESKIQQKVLHFCKQNAILAVKVDSTSSRGFPDLTCVLPNGTVLFVELKTDTGRLSKLQQHTIGKLEKNNANVHVIRSPEEFKELINSHT